ncbi:hypothetical protein BC829DRAFT_442835 [Chytridium lagenaria]|nr:hypothetical protein BC829DRAFT_442835 [Chytridium lagenaria]
MKSEQVLKDKDRGSRTCIEDLENLELELMIWGLEHPDYEMLRFVSRSAKIRESKAVIAATAALEDTSIMDGNKTILDVEMTMAEKQVVDVVMQKMITAPAAETFENIEEEVMDRRIAKSCALSVGRNNWMAESEVSTTTKRNRRPLSPSAVDTKSKRTKKFRRRSTNAEPNSTSHELSPSHNSTSAELCLQSTSLRERIVQSTDKWVGLNLSVWSNRILASGLNNEEKNKFEALQETNIITRETYVTTISTFLDWLYVCFDEQISQNVSGLWKTIDECRREEFVQFKDAHTYLPRHFELFIKPVLVNMYLLFSVMEPCPDEVKVLSITDGTSMDIDTT